MNSVGENLIAFLAEDPAISAQTGNRIHQGYVPNAPTGPYIWFVRRGVDWDDCLDTETSEPLADLFDLECWAQDLGDLLDEVTGLATAVRKRLHRHGIGSSGREFGDGQVQVINVSDQSDDYEPKGDFDDRPWHFVAFDVEIVPVRP